MNAPLQISIGECNGALLDELEAFLARFVAYPSEAARVAHVLWITHTHLMDVWDSTPRIAFLSPEPGSGKTRALEITQLLVPRPVEAVNVTPAYLFRKVADPEGPPTVLFDEIDTVFGPKARDNEELRGLLNAGHRRGAVAGRCVMRGKNVETEEIPAYCAVALAGLGNLPDTILSRSVIIRMRRRAPDETVEPYRYRVHAADGNTIRDRLSGWAEQAASNLANFYPDLPDGIVDRDADVWEPLIAVADEFGGRWSLRARAAATDLVAQSKDSAPSLGLRLLTDLFGIFGDAESLFTKDIIDQLVAIDDAPWADLRGNQLDARMLARFLKPYGVNSGQLRINEKVGKGYRRDDLHDAWQRYLPASLLDSKNFCQQCGKPGDLVEVYHGDIHARLHRECQDAYLAFQSVRNG